MPDKEGYPDKENFEVIQFDTTRKLLEKLTAAIVLDEFKWLNGAIYRGQADASWGLTPKIFRQTTALPSSEHFSQTSLRELTTAAELDYEFQLIYIELILMERFLHYADQIGLAVKNDSMQLRQQIRSAKEEADKWASRMKRGSGDTDLQKDPSLLESWPAEWALQLLSLMQHHRLPTRFLDWTTKPLHAAYFAAEDAVRNRREGGCLAIYACPPNVFTDWVDERADADGKYHTYSNRHGAFSVQVPTSDNPNIVGQRGLFTVKAVSPDSHLNTVHFESVVAPPVAYDDSASKKSWDHMTGRSLTSYCFLLPHECAENLLLSLRDYGTKANTMFPTWDGVADAVREHYSMWDQSRTDEEKNCSGE